MASEEDLKFDPGWPRRIDSLVYTFRRAKRGCLVSDPASNCFATSRNSASKPARIDTHPQPRCATPSDGATMRLLGLIAALVVGCAAAGKLAGGICIMPHTRARAWNAGPPGRPS